MPIASLKTVKYNLPRDGLHRNNFNKLPKKCYCCLCIYWQYTYIRYIYFLNKLVTLNIFNMIIYRKFECQNKYALLKQSAQYTT